MNRFSSTLGSKSRRVSDTLLPVEDPNHVRFLRLIVFALIGIIALLPVVWTLTHAFSTSRNVAYWDEIDSVLPFLLQLKAGMTVEQFVLQLLAVTNEHRTATSRLLFAVSYWCTGTVDFVWIAAIGNAFLVTACGLLVAVARGTMSRLQLAVILGFGLFHLGHYESFLWSGSSIDHFQILPLAIAAFVGLGRCSARGFGMAGICGVLATFTLAHGLVVWPVGALLLARDRRWRELLNWTGIAAIAVAIYFNGFDFNVGHRIGTNGAATTGLILAYWCKMLGAPLAFGHAATATVIGALLIIITGIRSVSGAWERERVFLPVLWFLVGAALLIAIGRAEFRDGELFSRYLILGGLGWALVLFDGLNRWWCSSRPLLALACVTPLLAGFNYAQNVHYGSDAATFVENRDRAALRYRQHGEDGRAAVTLHPTPSRATEMLAAADRQAVYRMPPLCELREFPDATPSARISYFVDEFTLNSRAAYLAGWAAIPSTKLRRGQIHVVLRSADAFAVFTTVPVRRPDVVKAFGTPDWEWSGFRFALQRGRLPAGDYQIGFLVDGEIPEFVITEHRLNLTGDGAALLAKSE